MQYLPKSDDISILYFARTITNKVSRIHTTGMELRITNLSKRFGDQWILRDVEFSVRLGTVVCICGAAGSGKSTLLRLIAGKEKANGGTFTDLSSEDVYFSDPGNSRGLLSIFGASGERRSAGSVAFSHLDSSLKSPKNIILLDEPFAGMDRETRSRSVRTIREAAKLGKTVIFAAADFKHPCEAAENVIMLDRGTVMQAGTPQEVYENPVSASVAVLTGMINLIEARRLTSSNADIPEFHTINGGLRIFSQAVAKSRLGAINQNMLLGIRPEDVVIAMNASFPEDNVIRATVTDVRFDGETSLVDLDAGGLSLTARVFKVVGLNIGDECMLGLPPHRVAVLN
ncbi:MAG: ATP-binding cassette domain-containing protein [Acidobacteriota bacterium]|nr:MAG: ATP-binding cassette domain-containing protein [Acidobacteriota bacterium]